VQERKNGNEDIINIEIRLSKLIRKIPLKSGASYEHTITGFNESTSIAGPREASWVPHSQQDVNLLNFLIVTNL
jgi:hypothetical protein